MIVEIADKGNIEFPDGTDPKVIDMVVKRDFFPEKSQQKEETFLSKVAPSIQRTGEIYQEEVQSGMGAMKRAVEEPTGRNVVQGFLGALQYGFSPLTAVAKGIVREPIEQIPQALDAPEWVTKFVGDLAENATYMVPYGSVVKQAMNVTRPVLEAGIAKSTEQIGKSVVGKAPLKFPETVSPEAVAEATTPISETSKAVLREDVVADVINAVKEPVSKVFQPTGTKRITQEVIDYVMANKEEIPKAMEKYGLSAEQLAAQIKETMSTSGRQLGQMGKWAKEIYKEFETPEMRQLAGYMEKDLPEATTIDAFMGGFKKIENLRRAGLVSQMATAMRNIGSQGMRMTLGSIDDAMQGAIKGMVSGEGAKDTAVNTLKGLGEGLDIWTAAYHRMTPSGRQVVKNLLENTNALEAKAKMFEAPIQDVTLSNRVVKLLNTMNTTQEFFFRNLSFEAKLNQLVKNAGFKEGLKGIDTKIIPESMYGKAADYALDMTFASMPKSKFGKEWVKSMSNPVFTALLNPFPRFLWGNAVPFLKNFSPIGFLEAVNPKVVAELAAGNPERFANSASRAILGTMMLNTALSIRNNPEIAGEKWYEIKVGNGVMDTRAFAPFSSYLFLAEAWTNPDKVKPADFGTAIISLNRVAGTGLILTDLLRAKKGETVMNTLERLGGEYLGSFTVPARTIKDLYSGYDKQEAILRDVRDKEFVGPTMRNIPIVSQSLPEAVSPLKTEPLKAETPILRQFTGLSLTTKSLMQKEVDRIALDTTIIYPRTGIPEADREMSKRMSPLVDKLAPILLENPMYQKLDESRQRILLSELFKEIKAEANKGLIQDNPKLMMKVRMKRQPEDLKTILGIK
jgi:hypothetical protein